MSADCCTHDPGSPDAAPLSDSAQRRVLWAALVINAAMFVLEAVAGERAHSSSLQADALDFLADAANYAVSLFVVGAAAARRARAALLKGASMGLFGVWVLGQTAYRVATGTIPEADVMGVVGVLALLANLLVLALLVSFRRGDANLRSAWICSRNDAAGNLAVLLAAAGVFATGGPWPDVVVAIGMAALALIGAAQIVRQARAELRAEVPSSPPTRTGATTDRHSLPTS